MTADVTTPNTPAAAGLPNLPVAVLRKIRWAKLGGGWMWHDWGVDTPLPGPQFETADYFTADQMQAYALAALSALPQQAIPEPLPEAVVIRDETGVLRDFDGMYDADQFYMQNSGRMVNPQFLFCYAHPLSSAPLPAAVPQKNPDHLDSGVCGGVTQWQPIETVPEHCAVLIFTGNRGIKIERAEHARRLLEEARANGEECFYTHWMHLPDDPSAPTGEGA